MGRRPATAMDWAAGICTGAAEASGGRGRGSRPATVAGGAVPDGRKRSLPGWCQVDPRPEGPRMPRRADPRQDRRDGGSALPWDLSTTGGGRARKPDLPPRQCREGRVRRG